jgi:hypothetical protein
MKNTNTLSFNEKPLNAKFYAFDQVLPVQDNASDDFLNKLSTFMVNAMNLLLDHTSTDNRR